MARTPSDWRQVLRRAEILVRRRDVRSLEVLLPALSWQSTTARRRVVALFARLGPLAVPHLLTKMDESRTAVERVGVAEALGRIGDSRAITRLMRALEDPAMTVRRASIVALLRLEAMNAVPRIIARLEDPSLGVRVMAADVLGRFEDPRAVPALIRVLRDEPWQVRLSSAKALGQIGDLRAAPALEKATRDSRASVARAAATALRSLRS